MRVMWIPIVVLLTGCATAPSPQAAAVVDAEEKMVEGCRYVGNVSGESLVGGYLMQSIGRSNAVAEARSTAADLGATHIVWSFIDSNVYGGTASGSAYRCET